MAATASAKEEPQTPSSEADLPSASAAMNRRRSESSAKRAGQTADVVKEAGGLAMEVQSEDALYNAPGDALLEYLRGIPEEASHVLLVAHLPGVAELVSLLTTEHVDLGQVFGHATLAGVMVDGNSWQDFDYGTGMLTLFLPPLLRLNEG